MKTVKHLKIIYSFHLCSTSSMPENVPPDHMLVLLEGLVTMSHYCLLDNAQQDISVGPVLPPNHSNIVNDTGSAGQIFSNLINVFNPYGNSRVRWYELSGKMNDWNELVCANSLKPNHLIDWAQCAQSIIWLGFKLFFTEKWYKQWSSPSWNITG